MASAMHHELIGECPAAHERQQIGIFLRHAFPLGLGSFSGLPEALKESDSPGDARDEAARLAD